MPSALTAGAAIADNLGPQAGGGPETGTSSSRPAGTYFITVVNYGAVNPSWTMFRISQP